MFTNLLLLAASAMGTNYGYEPLPEGGMKYIVQFTPEMLAEAQQAGLPVESEIPAEIGEVRSVSIRLGTGPLPQQKGKSENAVEKALAAKTQNSRLPPLLKGPQGESLASQASFDEPITEQKTSQESKAASVPSTAGEPSKPWWPLSFVSVLLFASLGGNMYLLWVFAELRKRYRAMLAK